MKHLVVAAAAACTMQAALAADALPAQPVKDPHYGDVLFHFYQDKHFGALTSLMVSQHFDRVAMHADEAEVLRGGLLLSFGLHHEAGQVFARLLEGQAPPSVRDRAWYFLAKIRYQRGALAEAQSAIERITGKLPGALEEDRVLLTAQLALARGDFALAVQTLEALKDSPTAGLYARFNVGVAMIAAGDPAGGSAMLDAVGQAAAPSEELRALRDRANVALGFAALQGEAPQRAHDALKRVRLNAAHSNKALLGFGWAASELQKHDDALVPWTELVARDASDAAVLEARIALPYALAELNRYGQALERYEEAVQVYAAERKALDESIAAVRAGRLVDALLERNPGEGMGWFGGLATLPQMPHAGHLAPVLAGHEFQESFKNLRDLLFLADNLERWKDSLATFGDMLDNRREAYAKRLPMVKAQSADTGIPALEKRHETLAAEFAKADAETDAFAFLTRAERELNDRIERSRAALQNAPAGDAELDAARERLRRASGALLWQAMREYPDRRWQAAKALREIETGLVEARGREAALVKAQQDEPARFEAFAGRIVDLDKRLAALMPRVATLSVEQRKQVQEIAVAELQRQQLRLDDYTAQARLAIAQILDRAQLARGSGDAPR